MSYWRRLLLLISVHVNLMIFIMCIDYTISKDRKLVIVNCVG